eukprot:CAMPEP_0170472362 /NCGR_PEP_ID=MMETSP0123-20130129/14413_1 /TAXON_ID=182087 /ORGANISM="Favella ehrenbergii, Strain Fehren 1" /LENGTH=76 /DNA_ID=CAMNT_0010740597 /DNA_START=191 /DNA_END=421 /DNA_ORIENTATION=+
MHEQEDDGKEEEDDREEYIDPNRSIPPIAVAEQEQEDVEEALAQRAIQEVKLQAAAPEVELNHDEHGGKHLEVRRD